MHTLESWSHDVHPFGRLIINVPFNVKVVPVNAEEFPFQDKAFLALYADTEKGHAMIDVIQWNQFFKCHVEVRDHEKELLFNGMITEDGHKAFQHKNIPLECLIQVPVKFGVSLHVQEEGNADVEDMECHQVHINTQNGDTLLKNLKCGTVHAHSWTGNIKCVSSLQGNIELKTGNGGAIKADKLQGQHVQCKTQDGTIQVKSVYADDANFWSQSGAIYLGSVHGSTVVDVHNKGDVKIDSLDGSLNALMKEGNLAAHITRHEEVTVRTGKGDISLDLPVSANTSLELLGSQVEVDKALSVENVEEKKEGNLTKFTGKMNSSGKGSVKSEARDGKIVVTAKDWFESLNLSKK
ncbi:protein FAM185A [Lingula anatina]|uniref:Protein FAM185A n=1 Tax=Lingula anatina TaxID=7574 RepID=A0A1S3HDM8_LINAN|nr:protein FAM185A [Lingula anatina]|eukprot:XP_013384125.1 protein FAM185A [Lingula anatina]